MVRGRERDGGGRALRGLFLSLIALQTTRPIVAPEEGEEPGSQGELERPSLFIRLAGLAGDRFDPFVRATADRDGRLQAAYAPLGQSRNARADPPPSAASDDQPQP